MKNTILFIALFLTTNLFSQSDLISYTVDTGEKINEIQVIAFTSDNEMIVGIIESIRGSVVKMQIAENTKYVITVNNARTIDIEPMTKEKMELALATKNEESIEVNYLLTKELKGNQSNALASHP